jgi:hypothetical protein
MLSVISVADALYSCGHFLYLAKSPEIELTIQVGNSLLALGKSLIDLVLTYLHN